MYKLWVENKLAAVKYKLLLDPLLDPLFKYKKYKIDIVNYPFLSNQTPNVEIKWQSLMSCLSEIICISA